MVETDFAIKPEKGNAVLDTSDWPLLLKVMYFFFLKPFSLCTHFLYKSDQ